jgi:hypothetical protein
MIRLARSLAQRAASWAASRRARRALAAMIPPWARDPLSPSTSIWSGWDRHHVLSDHFWTARAEQSPNALSESSRRDFLALWDDSALPAGQLALAALLLRDPALGIAAASRGALDFDIAPTAREADIAHAFTPVSADEWLARAASGPPPLAQLLRSMADALGEGASHALASLLATAEARQLARDCAPASPPSARASRGRL